MPNTDDLNRTVFISDNLPFLQALDTKSVDLVIIDPPFDKNQTFVGQLKPRLSKSERTVEKNLMDSWGVYDDASAYELGIEYPDQTGETVLFKDIWRFERVMSEQWWLQIKDTPIWWVIEAARRTHGNDTAAYIAFMAQRLIEIRRVLKPDGSVYLHCDHTANAYLRQAMDGVFGAQNFRNSITWKRTSAHNDAQQFGAVSDTILFYGGRAINADDVRVPLDTDYVEEFYRGKDERGQYRLGDLKAAGRTRDGESGKPWRGIDPGNRHWAVPIKSGKGEYGGWIERNIIPGYTRIESPHARLDALDEAGLIYWPQKKGGVPQLKRYLAASDGQVPPDIWTDIRPVGSSRENTGYPTQKPQALARRMILASSDPGDLVLDCFAGCAYVPVAAELAGRRWIACDMSPRAWTTVRRQFSKQKDLRILTEGEFAESEGVLSDLGDTRVIYARGPRELPSRTDNGDGVQMLFFELPAEIKFRQKPLETDSQIWQAFVDEWGTSCWYCSVQYTADRRLLHLDHVEPNAKDGSNDDCWNRALACAACNSDKGDKLSPSETMDKALEAGRIQTRARRDETSAAFSVRREWARKRYESLLKAKELSSES